MTSGRGVLLTLSVAALTIAPAVGQTAQVRPAAPQQPSLTFRSAANYVEVDATVTDAAGDPIRDLKCVDFDVLEDGRAQTLDACGFVDLPTGRPSPPPSAGRGATIVEPDVVTNEKRFDGRVYLLFLDSFHVSMFRSSQVRAQAGKFIDSYMGENDLGAVVQVGNPSAGQEFTANKRLLKASVARFTGQGLPSQTLGLALDARYKDQLLCLSCTNPVTDVGPPVDKDLAIREFMARQSLDSMRRLAEYLGELGGRKKAMLLFSEGIEVSGDRPPDPVVAPPAPSNPLEIRFVNDPRHDYDSVRLLQHDMIAAATRNNVSIYAIDPRGFTTGAEDVVLLGPMATAPPPQGRSDAIRNYTNPFMASDLRAEVRRSQDTLRTFADETGGLAIVDQNDMDAAFDRIVRDNSSYYVLGYAASDPKHDGRYHRISVRVRRPGARVRLRSGYFAPTAQATDRKKQGKTPLDPVTDMLRSPAPIGGLAMRANASVIKGLPMKSTVHLTVEFGGQDVALKTSGALYTNDIDVEYLALDMNGMRQAGGREIAHLQLQPETRAAFPRNGMRYITEFELGPGRYQVRVAAREHLGGRTGSVFSDVEVPDFAALPLALSDLLITASSATRTPTPNNTSTIGNMLPSPTTTAREFTAADTLTVAASIYDNDTRATHQVDCTATVRSDAGTQVFLREDHRPGGTLTATKGGFNWVVPVPLKGLVPGRYVLTIEARSTLSGVEPVRKETEFRIK